MDLKLFVLFLVIGHCFGQCTHKENVENETCVDENEKVSVLFSQINSTNKCCDGICLLIV